MKSFLETVVATAFTEAQKAGGRGEIPVAAVVFAPETERIVAVASNRTEQDNDPCAHAEILAIREACRKTGSPRLSGLDIYATLEPCPMCAAAISFARLRRLYFGAYDVKGGAVEHGCRLYDAPTRLYTPEVYGGIAETQNARLLESFFRALRKNGEKR